MFPLERSHSYVERAVYDAVVRHASKLKRGEWRKKTHPLAGLCYVASEALFHLQPTRYRSMQVMVEGASHWYLIEKSSGAVVDLTFSQFEESIPYENAKGRGFLTKKPSKRAQIIIDDVLSARSRETAEIVRARMCNSGS